jgi:hypothetical protein
MSLLVVIPCIALMITIGVCTHLFVTLKRDLRVVETRALRGKEDLRTGLAELADELESLRRGLEIIERKSDATATMARTIGLGARTHALRMIRHGESPEHVAAALGLPRSEVELLVKVQRLQAENPPSTYACSRER